MSKPEANTHAGCSSFLFGADLNGELPRTMSLEGLRVSMIVDEKSAKLAFMRVAA